MRKMWLWGLMALVCALAMPASASPISACVAQVAQENEGIDVDHVVPRQAVRVLGTLFHIRSRPWYLRTVGGLCKYALDTRRYSLVQKTQPVAREMAIPSPAPAVPASRNLITPAIKVVQVYRYRELPKSAVPGFLALIGCASIVVLAILWLIERIKRRVVEGELSNEKGAHDATKIEKKAATDVAAGAMNERNATNDIVAGLKAELHTSQEKLAESEKSREGLRERLESLQASAERLFDRAPDLELDVGSVLTFKTNPSAFASLSVGQDLPVASVEIVSLPKAETRLLAGRKRVVMTWTGFVREWAKRDQAIEIALESAAGTLTLAENIGVQLLTALGTKGNASLAAKITTWLDGSTLDPHIVADEVFFNECFVSRVARAPAPVAAE